MDWLLSKYEDFNFTIQIAKRYSFSNFIESEIAVNDVKLDIPHRVTGSNEGKKDSEKTYRSFMTLLADLLSMQMWYLKCWGASICKNVAQFNSQPFFCSQEIWANSSFSDTLFQNNNWPKTVLESTIWYLWFQNWRFFTLHWYW